MPPALDALILSCLEKDPADRPATAEDLAAALDAITFDDPWSRARATEWWQVHMQSKSSR